MPTRPASAASALTSPRAILTFGGFVAGGNIYARRHTVSAGGTTVRREGGQEFACPDTVFGADSGARLIDRSAAVVRGEIVEEDVANDVGVGALFAIERGGGGPRDPGLEAAYTES